MTFKSGTIIDCLKCHVHGNSAMMDLNSEQSAIIQALKMSQIYEAGQTIFKEGAPFDGVFCIRTGAVRISRRVGNKKGSVITRIANPGDLIGYGNPAGSNYARTAIAMEETQVCRLPKELFQSLKNENSFCRGLLRVVDRTVHQGEARIFNLSSRSLRERLAFVLVDLIHNFGVASPHGWTIRLKITRKDIASLSGTVIESVARTLTEFEEEKVVVLEGRKIHISNLQQLEKIAGMNIPTNRPHQDLTDFEL